MAVGSRGSVAVASSNQAVKSRIGSSAMVKSPDVNQLGCSIGAVSDIGVLRVGGTSTRRYGGLYSGCGRPRLCRGMMAASALTLALCNGGCSLSGHFDSLFGSSSERTGTITPPPGTKENAQLPPDTDLAYARAAVSAVLSRGEKDTSMP